jgi:hypothetical protein
MLLAPAREWDWMRSSPIDARYCQYFDRGGMVSIAARATLATIDGSRFVLVRESDGRVERNKTLPERTSSFAISRNGALAAK